MNEEKRSFTRDATSGFQVFLIALPLCLGIALASGFPPIAGVLTAIVGGLGVSHIGSARLTIKGPAAGLIVIALGAVTELGMGDAVLGYRRALAVGVAAAVLQIILAALRAGRLAAIMPPSVVHGMLAAIGVIIIAKQTPVVLGVTGAHGEPLEMLRHVPEYVTGLNPAIFGIGALALLILVVWPRLPKSPLSKIPPALVVLLVAVPLALMENLPTLHDYSFASHIYATGPRFLVQLPGALLDAITFPDFSVIASPISLKYVAMFTFVGAIESLLSVLAVDALDPAKHASNLDRDLMATGIGNLVCGLIGGLPMISEIVRSKANLDAGAKSQWSNFFHGLFLLAFVALAPGLLQLIPLAALAAMLVVVGFRLAGPKEFRHAWELGSDQFALFFTTFAVTLLTDLLIGVAAGIALKLAMHAVRTGSLRALFRSNLDVHRDGGRLVVGVHGPLTFANLLSLQKALGQVDDSIDRVEVDLKDATLIDHTVLERIRSAADEWKNASLSLLHLDELTPRSDHAASTRVRL